MRNSIKIIIGMGALICIGLIYFWPYVQMEFAESAHYTEQDKREYEFYTPEVLKKMPRVSNDYSFDFANITGPATHVNAIKFSDVKDISRIEEYLMSSGYVKGVCDFESPCWRNLDPREAIFIDNTENDKVVVQVVYDFTEKQ
ncbi:hypothetical protein H8R20_02370 [Morganella morganii]|uniref:hypothetical protein n=1 Tax=Morganella morganii TaxID=582 RepID=UPI001646D22C|nr:hypothetical protein [Morganella morganii]MBC3994432.1 hypothetical protein [Morganella morganii]